MQTKTIFPAYLQSGDKVAIISPATTVKADYVHGAAKVLEEWGLCPEIFPHALGPEEGTFASSLETRLSDLRQALQRDDIKAIFCARGGYGCVHIVAEMTPGEVRQNPKWLIGFSDVSALHALWHEAGVASIHGPMAKHLAVEGPTHISSMALRRMLTANRGVAYTSSAHPFNQMGAYSGTLIGGNLAVLNGLAGTPYDMLATHPGDAILFIEDISEAIYEVERMLTRLKLAGVLDNIKGLIVGQFTEYRPDRSHETMEHMVHSLLTRYGLSHLPVAFDFPVGHVSINHPLVIGDKVTLSVTPDGASLFSNLL